MLRNYLITAYKVFMRRKLFTLINLLCIVLTLLVLMVVTALLEHTFFPSSGAEAKSGRMLQVLMMSSRSPDGHARRTSPLGYKVIETYLRPMASLERVAAVTLPRTVSVYKDGQVSAMALRRTDAEYWKVLEFTLLAGRLITAEDDQQGRHVAVLNQTSAERLFGKGQAIGQKISAGGQLLEVIGVVRDEFHLNAYADIWAPISTYPSAGFRNEMAGDFVALLLARDAADLPAIRQEVARIAGTVVFDDPKKWASGQFWADSKLDILARTVFNRMEVLDSGGTRLLAIIGAAMLLFMLLPALNLVNLNVGRVLERSGEIGVRKAFGATSWQLMGQLIVENILLCLAGGVLGLLGTAATLAWLESSGLIPYLRVDLNFAVLGYGMLLTLIFGLLSGLLPAWKMSRLEPVHALKGTL